MTLDPTAFWDREAAAPLTPPDAHWMANPIVRRYIGESITGDPRGWPLDWFQQQTRGRTFQHALSIGCGTGPLERDLVRRGIATRIDAFDGSPKSIEIARAEAAATGYGHQIAYFVDDFNTIELPRAKYDLVCFHQSLHHVEKLERLLWQVRRTLTPDGLLYLDEYVGPSRTYWNARSTRWYRVLYHLLPRGVRYFDDFQPPVQPDDPSEAVRSGDILSRVAIGFDIEAFRGYGGNLLAVLFPDLSLPHVTDADVTTLIEAEQMLLEGGDHPFYAALIARPKARGVMPALRYTIEGAYPDMTRRLRDVIRRLRG